jgi:hypothetical protein
MKKVLWFAILLSVLSCSNEVGKKTTTEAANRTNDFVVIPGERVGMITGNTTEAALLELYGKENVQIQSVPIAEGDAQEGVVLFPNTPNAIEIIWETATSEGTPAFVRIGNDSTEWQTPEGITVGTSLEKLEEVNGKPFIFNGFEWDYGGLVTDWQAGKLSKNLVIALVPQNFDALGSGLSGEVQLSSDDPRVRTLRARVGSIVVTFGRE